MNYHKIGAQIMKKLILTLFSIISVCAVFAFVGCGEQSDETTAEPDGKLHTIFNAYNEKWIDGDDLKSIACSYYEWRNIEENPYSGFRAEPFEPLGKETENKIKEAFSDQSEEIKIIKYYGNYEGNVAVTLGYGNTESLGGENTDVTIGGIIFPEFKLYPVYIYHYFEKADPTIRITGRLFGIKAAYENGLIDENDLKSIACCVNDRDGSAENPYAGMYEEPSEKLSRDTKNELKQAFLRQIYDDSASDLLDGIKICRYFGSYHEHTVVSIIGDRCRFGASTEGTEIGGVTFLNSDWQSIYVY